MGIEGAFLLGLFLGHWLTLWILWRASVKVLEKLASMQRDPDEQPASGAEIIYFPLDHDDNDWVIINRAIVWGSAHHLARSKGLHRLEFVRQRLDVLGIIDQVSSFSANSRTHYLAVNP